MSVHHHLIMPQLTQHHRCILGHGGGELHPYLMKHAGRRETPLFTVPSRQLSIFSCFGQLAKV